MQVTASAPLRLPADVRRRAGGIFRIVAVTGIAIGAAAVPAESQEIRIGVVAGPSLALSDFSDSESELVNTDVRRGVSAGVILSFPLDGRWSLRSGLAYVEKGTRGRSVGGPLSSRLHVDLRYLEVPLSLEYRFPLVRSLHLTIGGGPAIAVRTSCDARAISVLRTIDLDCEGESERFDFGAMVRGGVDLEILQSLRLLLDASYTHGLVDVYDFSGRSAKNRTSQIHAGVSAPLGLLLP